jgi:glycosyltransferase involved in cell wall biosynthesis
MEHSGVPDYLNSLDIYAAPSLVESFGVSVVEAMAAGLPVVATNVGGLPEVIGDIGILVPPRHPESLARGLESLLGQEIRERLGRQGRKRVEDLFDFERNLDQMLALYGDVLLKGSMLYDGAEHLVADGFASDMGEALKPAGPR